MVDIGICFIQAGKMLVNVAAFPISTTHSQTIISKLYNFMYERKR
ncbi:hypothetical protein C671_3142 [[Clostridium] bifermentans ATCC 19299]|nr:hypothetical protein C671_3142 [[Clostridium] bifermentans ATCC 19299] [Paraclostridium bifermentans ATCC 19299]